MACTPIRNAAAALIDVYEHEGLVGPDAVFSRIADGHTIGAIAKDIGVSRQSIYWWIDKRGLGDLLVEARRRSAESMVDDAHDIAEQSNGVTIAVDRERIKIKTWTAARLDRDRFGDSPKVSIGFDMGGAFVGMMRRLSTHTAATPLVQDVVGSTQQTALVPRNISHNADTTTPAVGDGSTQHDVTD